MLLADARGLLEAAREQSLKLGFQLCRVAQVTDPNHLSGAPVAGRPADAHAHAAVPPGAAPDFLHLAEHLVQGG